jgi:hypothetical protein
MTNPTSNFGWQMPTSTDLVTDLPADFEVFGQAVDTTLVDLKGGTTGQVLKKNSNTDMDFVWGADSAGMTNPMTTTGDTIYSSSGSTPARLGIGSTGNVLTVAGGVPTWAAPAGGGKVAQVVSVTTTSSNSTTSSTYQDCSGLTATITPTAATSKVMIFIQANLNGFYAGDNSCQFDLAINGAGSVIYDLGRTNWWEENTSTNKRFFTTIPLMYLHSPATTSATTYKLQMRQRFGGTVSFNDQTNISSITLMEILA